MTVLPGRMRFLDTFTYCGIWVSLHTQAAENALLSVGIEVHTWQGQSVAMPQAK